MKECRTLYWSNVAVKYKLFSSFAYIDTFNKLIADYLDTYLLTVLKITYRSHIREYVHKILLKTFRILNTT